MKRDLLFLLNDLKDLPEFPKSETGWSAKPAPNSENALQALSQTPFEAIVVDVRFQTGEDLPFLTKVVNRCPQVIRIVLCDPTAKEPTKTETSAHQYLTKPCTPESVVTAVERARLVEAWLKVPQIKELYGRMHNLPSIPSIYFRLINELQSPDAELETIGAIIAEDLVMTAKVLQVVNSALFGLSHTITSPVEAVSYLGMERTKALALVAQTFSNYTPPPGLSFSMEKLWQHSMGTANLAQMITREETGDSKMAETAFTAGLLHDVGKLTLAVNLPDEYQAVLNRAQTQKIPFYEAEEKVLGATHAEVGACIMGTWGLPAVIVEALGFHHHPENYFEDTFTPATAVHMASLLEYESRSDTSGLPQQLNLDYLAKLGLDKRIAVWREIIGNPADQPA